MFGKKVKLFVADAKYRSSNRPYDEDPQAHGIPQLSVTDTHFNGSGDDPRQALSYNKDDAWIQSTYAELKKDGTAKSNTDSLEGRVTRNAATFCRYQDIPGIGELDLPNLYELIILYLESDNIDHLDPTAYSNRDKALGKMSTYGRFKFSDNTSWIWSSTEHDSKNACGLVGHGLTSYWNQYSNAGVIPVKELSIS